MTTPVQDLRPRYQGGRDDEALRFLEEAHLRVQAISYALVLDLQDASEVASEVLREAYRRRPEWPPDARRGRWLLGLTHEACKSHLALRHRRVVPVARLHAAGAIPRPVAECLAAGTHQGPIVAAALNELPTPQRALVVLHALGPVGPERVAEFLGGHPQAVEAQTSQALSALATVLGVGEDVTSSALDVLASLRPAPGTALRLVAPAGSSPDGLLVGRELGGYRVEARIAQGGMGAVYRATQLSMGRTVALKVLAPELARDEGFVKRFLREARAAGNLNHQSIIKVYDVGEVQPGVVGNATLYYFAMELVEGQTVRDRLARDGRLPPTEALAIVTRVAEALEHASAHGVIHRDIKPDNILISSAGEVKLADLGLAKRVDPDQEDSGTFRTQAGMILGTAHYMSPEQAHGQALDCRTDIYSLGATFFHMLVGQVPFPASSSIEVLARVIREEPEWPPPGDPRMPPPYRAVVERMMARDRTQRYADFGALRVDLRTLAGGRPGGASRREASGRLAQVAGAGVGEPVRRTSSTHRTVPWMSPGEARAGRGTRMSRPRLWGLAAVAASAMGALAVVGYVAWRTTPHEASTPAPAHAATSTPAGSPTDTGTPSPEDTSAPMPTLTGTPTPTPTDTTKATSPADTVSAECRDDHARALARSRAHEAAGRLHEATLPLGEFLGRWAGAPLATELRSEVARLELEAARRFAADLAAASTALEALETREARALLEGIATYGDPAMRARAEQERELLAARIAERAALAAEGVRSGDFRQLFARAAFEPLFAYDLEAGASMAAAEAARAGGDPEPSWAWRLLARDLGCLGRAVAALPRGFRWREAVELRRALAARGGESGMERGLARGLLATFRGEIAVARAALEESGADGDPFAAAHAALVEAYDTAYPSLLMEAHAAWAIRLRAEGAPEAADRATAAALRWMRDRSLGLLPQSAQALDRYLETRLSVPPDRRKVEGGVIVELVYSFADEAEMADWRLMEVPPDHFPVGAERTATGLQRVGGSQIELSGPVRAVWKGRLEGDARVGANLIPQGETPAGLALCDNGEDRYYAAWLHRGGGVEGRRGRRSAFLNELVIHGERGWKDLATNGEQQLTAWESVRLDLVRSGAELELLREGRSVFVASDRTFAGGHVALLSLGGRVWFGHVGIEGRIDPEWTRELVEELLERHAPAGEGRE